MSRTFLKITTKPGKYLDSKFIEFFDFCRECETNFDGEYFKYIDILNEAYDIDLETQTLNSTYIALKNTEIFHPNSMLLQYEIDQVFYDVKELVDIDIIYDPKEDYLDPDAAD